MNRLAKSVLMSAFLKAFPRHGKHPQPNWPDFIEYDKEEGTGRNVYFGGRVEKWPAD
jgi:hypothetical protein